MGLRAFWGQLAFFLIERECALGYKFYEEDLGPLRKRAQISKRSALVAQTNATKGFLWKKSESYLSHITYAAHTLYFRY